MICPQCGSNHIVKNGGGRVYCRECGKYFQENYRRDKAKEKHQEDIVAQSVRGVKFKQADWRALLSDGANRAKTRRELTGFSQESTFTFGGPYVDILMLSDIHLGDAYTDHDLFLHDLNLILKTPFLKIMINGDALDNFHSSKLLAPMLEQVFSPAEQKIILLNILDELIKADKLMLFVLGNHEGFDFKSSGDSIFQELDFSGVPIANNRAVCTINVGDIKYRADFIHKTVGHSMYNKQHGNIRNLRENSPDADIIVSSHTHSPGFEFTTEYGRPVFLIKTGTYKGSDNYSWSSWPNGQRPYFPIIRLFSGEKKMRHIQGIDELLEA